jgi:hypothetical protein
MSHEELVFEALSWFRHVGASEFDIRWRVYPHEKVHRTRDDDLEALRTLRRESLVFDVGRSWFLTDAGFKKARGSALQPEWKHEDPWLFLSVVGNRKEKKAGLAQVLANAGSINHEFPEHLQVHGALNRLHSAGLIEKQESNFTVTDEGLALYAKAETVSKRDLIGQWNALEALLSCPCCGVKLKSVRWRIRLDDQIWSDALDKAQRLLGFK